MADHFLALSPEEIYELAERATHADTASEGRPLSASADVLSSWREVVERVTTVLTDQLELPAFEEWLELYRTDPAGVEARLMGLWRED